MPKPKHEQMDFKGLEIVADEFTGTFNGTLAPDPADVIEIIAEKTEIAALVSPTVDYADLEAVTTAVKSIIDALKA